MDRQMSNAQWLQWLEKQTEWCRCVNPIQTQNCCVYFSQQCEDLQDTSPRVVKAEVVRDQPLALEKK